jgi:hypothetical protein
MYFEHLINEEDRQKHNIKISKWVKDSEGMSIAHLKELFVATIILGDNYEDAVQTLTNMKEEIDDRDYDQTMGFKPKKASRHDDDDDE